MPSLLRLTTMVAMLAGVLAGAGGCESLDPDTSCSPSKPCASGSYCDYPDDECGASFEGTCHGEPGSCDDLVKQVCGCDGKTYGNACAAAAEGVSVAAQGECRP